MVGGIIPERSVSSEVGSRSALRARRLTRPVHLGLLPLSFNCQWFQFHGSPTRKQTSQPNVTIR